MNLTTHAPTTVLTEEDAADFLKVTTFALRKWRRQGCGPRAESYQVAS